MSTFRILAMAVLIAACGVLGDAQSSPNKTSAPVNSAKLDTQSGTQDSSTDGGSLPSSTERIRIRDYRRHATQFGPPPGLSFGRDVESVQDDTFCYTMRTYKVARDDKDSDSVHAAGYTTCQPATRFRTYTLEQRTTEQAP
jgi:hypothetical protein